MADRLRALSWTTVVPVLALIPLALTWGTKPGTPVLIVVGLFLAGSVLAAVHHAEVVAHRVGEPFGSLVLAVAVTVIEVALIVTLMTSGDGDTSTLARDTVFAAAMITTNGIVGICILIGALKRRFAEFNAEGTATALATVGTLATLTLVLPTFTTSEPGPEFSSAQLAFAAIASIVLYGLFVVVQTVRHRDYFLPPAARTTRTRTRHRRRTARPCRAWSCCSSRSWPSSGWPRRSRPRSRTASTRSARRTPRSASSSRCSCCSPRRSRAVRNARRDRMQTCFNLAYGSAIASIGLTIPAIAVASIWLDGPLVLGLGPTQMVLLAITAVVSALTVLPGRATLQEGGVHLVLFAAFVFLAVFP